MEDLEERSRDCFVVCWWACTIDERLFFEYIVYFRGTRSGVKIPFVYFKIFEIQGCSYNSV